MIKPNRLKENDTVAIVSLSCGMAGETVFRHRYEIGKKRLETEFGLNVVTMPNALKGIKYLDDFPKARAADMMDAFKDSSVKGIFCMIGGDDTIRLLKHIDCEVIRNNPKIFMGFSDTTSNHFMLYKAGLVSFYGPSILAGFAENVSMHEYTKQYVKKLLFEPTDALIIEPSPEWTSEWLEWGDEANNNIARKMTKDKRGYEVLQGKGVAQGALIGGCLDTFPMFMGSEIWPALQHWDDKILFLETSEEFPPPRTLKYFLRGLAAQGIIERLSGIVFGKPQDEKYYEEYKPIIKQVIGKEAGREDMPILYNLNFGHASPVCVLPYGVKAEINCDLKTFTLLEPAVR